VPLGRVPKNEKNENATGKENKLRTKGNFTESPREGGRNRVEVHVFGNKTSLM